MTDRHRRQPTPSSNWDDQARDYVPASPESVRYWLTRIRAQLAHTTVDETPPGQVSLNLDE